MRTKALVLTAALGAAGIASSYAQSVYSVNAVGYINVTCIPGFTMIANQLSSTNDTVGQLFTAPPDGSAILTWDQSAGTFVMNNFAFGAWDFPDNKLSPGMGVMFQNPDVAYTVTFVGEVIQGTNITVSLIPGFNMVSSKVPQAGTIQTALGFVPEEGDMLMKWSQSAGTYLQWSYTFGAWDPEEPSLAVGESAFISTQTAKDWVRSFTVN